MAEQTTQQEQQKLQKGKSYVTVVGKAKITDTTFVDEQQSKTSDYMYKRLNLGIETAEGNIVYGEQMGGYSPSMNYPIKVKTKPENKGEQGKKVEIAWADRLNESIVETISDFDLFKVGLIREGEEPAEGQEDTRKLVVKKFLSSYDAYDYIKEHLKDGMMIMAKGKYSFQKFDDDKKKFEIKDIFLSKSTEGFANFVQTILLDEDSISKDALKASKETGEVVISARAVDYVGKIKGKKVGKNMTFDFPVTVKVNEENPEITQTILSKLFKVKKGKIREITIEGQIFEGYDQQQISDKDIQLSDDVKQLIAMNLYSAEDAKKLLTVRGNKVSKMLFTRPFIIKDKDDATKIKMDFSDDKYVPEDLYVPMPEEEQETGDSEINLTDIAEETSNNQGDGWLKGLGL